MNFDVYEVAILKMLVLQKIEMPQYEDVNAFLNTILAKLENFEEVTQ
jgi:hypothetical protein